MNVFCKNQKSNLFKLKINVYFLEKKHLLENRFTNSEALKYYKILENKKNLCVSHSFMCLIIYWRRQWSRRIREYGFAPEHLTIHLVEWMGNSKLIVTKSNSNTGSRSVRIRMRSCLIPTRIRKVLISGLV